jgi:hypothetical protein
MPAERLQQVIERHLGDIDGEIEVAVDPGLMPNQCVDTPPAGNPDAVKPCPVGDTQHSADLGSGHVPASVVTDVCHHEASQAGAKLSGTGWPTAQRSCRSPTLLQHVFSVELCRRRSRHSRERLPQLHRPAAQGVGDQPPAETRRVSRTQSRTIYARSRATLQAGDADTV